MPNNDAKTTVLYSAGLMNWASLLVLTFIGLLIVQVLIQGRDWIGIAIMGILF
jgi:hypothetical protein